MVVVRDLKEVGLAGDERKGILTAGPLLTQKLIVLPYALTFCVVFCFLLIASPSTKCENVRTHFGP